MHYKRLFIALFLSAGIFMSCSGTGEMAQQQGNNQAMEAQKYPSWYPNQKVVSTDTLIFAYATAIADDSAGAVSKAESWAQSELKSYISDKLENIRSEALIEHGSKSGLDASRFMIALRRADNAVGYLVETGNTQVKTVEGYNSYRSFAEVRVSKDDLVERIGKRLGGYEQAWQAMKDSKAFKNF
ncbi:MAG: hypothetical protein U5J63_04900 [Fodinibius sp.]|nr:hypothetical protein [Fodinibius sp.]